LFGQKGSKAKLSPLRFSPPLFLSLRQTHIPIPEPDISSSGELSETEEEALQEYDFSFLAGLNANQLSKRTPKKDEKPNQKMAEESKKKAEAVRDQIMKTTPREPRDNKKRPVCSLFCGKQPLFSVFVLGYNV
jgi:hypothetical protein